MTTRYTAQGSLFDAKQQTAVPLPQKGGGTRGRITAFSPASRRRLIRLFARLEMAKIRTSFLTLTFHQSPSTIEAKAALKRFLMRLRRKYADVAGVWRMELQERGAIHFHLLIIHAPSNLLLRF